jgi:uncharacterized protein (TIGR02594 family)
MSNKAYLLAVAEIGTVEWSKGDNPEVLAYFRDSGHPEIKNDETAWCAAFVGAMLHRAGFKGTKMLTAQSYLKWGESVPISSMKQGDICIIKRGTQTWQGHVFFVHKFDGKRLWGLGGNQSNSVNIQEFPVDATILGVRRLPETKSTPPAPLGFFAALMQLFRRNV